MSYYNNLTLKEASVSIKPPYKLTVFPNKILGDDSTLISLELLNNTTINSISLFVVYPNGQKLPLNNTGFQGLQTFSIDNKSSNLMQGSYEVYLINASNNEIITTAGFNVTAPSLFNFLSTGGILTLVPVLSPVIVFMYNHFAEAMNKSKGRIEKKLDWMESSMKYYFGLMRGCFRINEDCNNVMTSKKTVEQNPELTKSLYHRMIRFANVYKTFNDELGFFYFEDVVSEEFLTRLNRELVLAYESIFAIDFPSFMHFANLYEEKYALFQDDPGNNEMKAVKEAYKTYKERLDRWLTSFKDKEAWIELHQNCCSHDLDLFRKNNLTMYLLLKINVNKIALLSYSSESKVKKSITEVAKNYKDELKIHIDSLNKEFYQDRKKLYYTEPFKL
jgi:hypothetical protein